MAADLAKSFLEHLNCSLNGIIKLVRADLCFLLFQLFLFGRLCRHAPFELIVTLRQPLSERRFTYLVR